MLDTDAWCDREHQIESALALSDRETAAGLLMDATRSVLLNGTPPGPTARAAWDLMTAEELVRAGAVADARRKYHGAFAELAAGSGTESTAPERRAAETEVRG